MNIGQNFAEWLMLIGLLNFVTYGRECIFDDQGQFSIRVVVVARNCLTLVMAGHIDDVFRHCQRSHVTFKCSCQL